MAGFVKKRLTTARQRDPSRGQLILRRHFARRSTRLIERQTLGSPSVLGVRLKFLCFPPLLRPPPPPSLYSASWRSAVRAVDSRLDRCGSHPGRSAGALRRCCCCCCCGKRHLHSVCGPHVLRYVLLLRRCLLLVRRLACPPPLRLPHVALPCPPCCPPHSVRDRLHNGRKPGRDAACSP